MNTKTILNVSRENSRLSLPFFKLRGLSVVSTVFLLAQFFILNTTSAAELKIGYVNAQRAIEESPQAKKARKRLDKEFSPRNKELEKAKKELRKMEEKLNRDGAIMSEPEQQKLERKIRADARDLKRASEEFREDLNLRRNEASERLRRRIFEVIKNIALKEKYDLILVEGVIYAGKKVEITEAVLKQLKNDMASKTK